jgi:ribose 1,5-bisphosphokinase
MLDGLAPLVYVMGPSGAGKDTLLAYARAHVDSSRILFAHRYITRSMTATGENHIALSRDEFFARREAGLFSLSWESHGNAYGIGTEIDLWQKHNFVVVVSGARAAWPAAKERFANIIGILVEAPADLRATRLAARGREDEAAIRARMTREIPMALDANIHRLDNSGSVEEAGIALVRLLRMTAEAVPVT